MPDEARRLIEVAFPLKQASLDSVHEKNVHRGHISTLHIWPARRPLAACRAALIATLLPDPGNDAERKRLLEMLAGTVTTKNTFKNVDGRKIPVVKEETEGGILHWGRENGPALDFFREEIKKAYGGRAPRVLDPFAGGGAIPLEAMRLGCEVTAADINPVAWFILKCTLEYPQRLAGQTRPLPRFALESKEFMASFRKAHSVGSKARAKKQPSQTALTGLQGGYDDAADLSWHVRAWGHWVLERARRDLERFYPTVDGKPTVAYLWARTVTCKNCRRTIPLLKTLWLCKNDKKRVRLDLKPKADGKGIDFDIVDEPVKGGNAAQRRAHDQSVGRGTMSRSGAWCPNPDCGKPGTVAMTLEDIRAEGMAERLGEQMTAVVVDGPKGKAYRVPNEDEQQAAQEAAVAVDCVFMDVPFGLPADPIIENAKRDTWCVPYGVDQWSKLFTPRQLVALGTFVKYTRSARDAMEAERYPSNWVEAVGAYLATNLCKTAHLACRLCTWHMSNEQIRQVFSRYALPVAWDFAESLSSGTSAGSYVSMLGSTVAAIDTALWATSANTCSPAVLCQSALNPGIPWRADVVVTDPPYYDAIGYSVLMDFFYVWLRRTLQGLTPEFNDVFLEPLAPKWDHETDDGEFVDDAHRFGGDAQKSKAAYEDGMFRAFRTCQDALTDDARMVVVFANKSPDAWETLASSVIRAGFVVDGSWPIQTEMATRTRAMSSAALSSSVWLVCRKRPETARPGWDSQVLEEMRSRIYGRLRDFWDAGIRGPDFVWAATGPALEAYSKHPVVKKADEPNSLMSVSEFLQHVRRIVVDYVVGRILTRNGPGDASALDDVTLYYLLHRNDFGLGEAPAGAVILYAQSCNLRDRDLADRFDLLSYGKGKAATEAQGEDEEAEEDGDAENDDNEDEGSTSGSTVKLKRWDQRRRKDLGLDAGGRISPLVDQVHLIMQLWRAGDVQKVDAYLEDQGLRQSVVFPRLLQALIELARKDNQSDERALLESIMNHVTARGPHPQMRLIMEER